MEELRKNEFIDLMNLNELLYQVKPNNIIADIPTLGQITYYYKTDKIQVHKDNTWLSEGFYVIKDILKEDVFEFKLRQVQDFFGDFRIQQKINNEWKDIPLIRYCDTL